MKFNQEKLVATSKEAEPTQQELVVDFVRHGDTKYTEIFPDITAKGEEEIRATAERIAATIDPQQEIVVLWISPTERAKGSAEVIERVFAEHKIEIAKRSSISSLRRMDVKDPDFIFGLFDKVREEGGDPGNLFLTHDAWAGDASEKVETRQEIRKRADRVMNYLQYIAEHADSRDKRLRIIATTHFEIMQPLIHDIFGREADELLKTGEDFEIRILHSKGTGDTDIEFSFRGNEKRGYRFDKAIRKFIPLHPHG